jgi:hypothetical protein
MVARHGTGGVDDRQLPHRGPARAFPLASTTGLSFVRASFLLLAVVLFLTTPSVAWANGDHGNARAAELVRQAIALIVNTPGQGDAIADKITDALNAKDTSSVAAPGTPGQGRLQPWGRAGHAAAAAGGDRRPCLQRPR